MPHPLKPTPRLRTAARATTGVYLAAIVVFLSGVVLDDRRTLTFALAIAIVGVAIDLRRLTLAAHVRTTQIVLLWREGTLDGVAGPVIDFPRDEPDEPEGDGT